MAPANFSLWNWVLENLVTYYFGTYSISVVRFYAFLSLSSSPRKMRKNAGQRLTPVAVVMPVRRPPWCITVCSWPFVFILYYFVYLDVRARVARVCARACARIRFRAFSCELNKISRFYWLTPKITYLGRFSIVWSAVLVTWCKGNRLLE